MSSFRTLPNYPRLGKCLKKDKYINICCFGPVFGGAFLKASKCRYYYQSLRKWKETIKIETNLSFKSWSITPDYLHDIFDHVVALWFLMLGERLGYVTMILYHSCGQWWLTICLSVFYSKLLSIFFKSGKFFVTKSNVVCLCIWKTKWLLTCVRLICAYKV